MKRNEELLTHNRIPMITSAEEFIQLRISEIPEEYYRSAHEEAALGVWETVIHHYPDYKEWVIHNKTVPIELLEFLVLDKDPKVRTAVARKRKINDTLFQILAVDPDEDVRYALICNTKLTPEQLHLIKTDDALWLREALVERLDRESKKG